jgi:hypothetical protein
MIRKLRGIVKIVVTLALGLLLLPLILAWLWIEAWRDWRMDKREERRT